MKNRIFLFNLLNILVILLLSYIISAYNNWRWPLLSIGAGYFFAAFLWFNLSWEKSIDGPLRRMADIAGRMRVNKQADDFDVEGYAPIQNLAQTLNDARSYYQSDIQSIMERLIESEELFIQMIFTINAAVEAKDPYTSGHSSKVSEYARGIARELNLPPEQEEKIALAALLHDVGKIGTRESILNKKDHLSEEEYLEIKLHTEVGRDILQNSSALWDVIPGIYYHHERYDGKGYPEGLKEQDIPLSARIIGVADAYDAMTSDRPYRKAMSGEEACKILIEEYNRQFEGTMVEAFLRSIGQSELLQALKKPKAI